MDEVADIVRIKIMSKVPIEHVDWGNSEYVRLGEDVVAIGLD